MATGGINRIPHAAVGRVILHKSVGCLRHSFAGFRIRLGGFIGGIVVLIIQVRIGLVSVCILVVPQLETGFLISNHFFVFRVYLFQVHLSVHTFQLDGVVIAPCRVLVLIPGQKAVHIQGHGEFHHLVGHRGCFICAQTISGQRAEVGIGFFPHGTVGTIHILGDSCICDIAVPTAVPFRILIGGFCGGEGFF